MTKNLKAYQPLSRPLNGQLDRSHTRKPNTHYPNKNNKNTVMGSPMLCHVLTSNNQQEKLPIKFRRTRKAVKKRKTSVAKTATLTPIPVGRRDSWKTEQRSRACLHKELQLVDTLRAELWFHVTKHSSSTARVKNLTQTKTVVSGKFMLDIAKSAPTGECAMDWTKSRRVLPARKRLGGRSLPPH